MPTLFKKSQLLLPLAASGLLLTSCGPGVVTVEAAPDAANPRCAYAMVAMPQQLAGLAQRETSAQATTAWGEPAEVILKCGVEVKGPVSDPCAQVNGVDWILKPLEEHESSELRAEGIWTATTFGREPEIRVTFNADAVSSSTILAELNSAVKQLEQTKTCTNIADTLTEVETEK